jgi:ArsR family transcriptional regulator
MNMVDYYKALADESRLRVLHVLSHGYFNVQELTSVLGLSQPTISHHLKTLQQAGLIKSHKEGTWTYHSLVSTGSETAAGAVISNFLELALNPAGDAYLPSLTEDRKIITGLRDRKRDRSRLFFESVASNWKEMRDEATGSPSYLEELVGHLPSEGTLLELGCGTGALLERILPRKGNTIGVDYSQAMLDEAKSNLGKLKGEVDLRLGYLEHLPLGDESVDTAVAYMVLHHLPTPREALRDIFRVLQPGGRLMIVDMLPHNKEYMRERYADLWLGFDADEMQSWLTECGFKDVQIKDLGERKEVFLSNCFKP